MVYQIATIEWTQIFDDHDWRLNDISAEGFSSIESITHHVRIVSGNQPQKDDSKAGASAFERVRKGCPTFKQLTTEGGYAFDSLWVVERHSIASFTPIEERFIILKRAQTK